MGGIINFNIDAGAPNALRTYLVLGSISGVAPGTLLPGGQAMRGESERQDRCDAQASLQEWGRSLQSRREFLLRLAGGSVAAMFNGVTGAATEPPHDTDGAWITIDAVQQYAASWGSPPTDCVNSPGGSTRRLRTASMR